MEENNKQNESMSGFRQNGTKIRACLPLDPDSPVSRTSVPSSHSTMANGQGTSFTEAFSFLRNTEFYSPPPAKPPPAPTSIAPTTSGAPFSTANISQQEEEANLASLSGQARNQILVSRRQQGNPILKHIRNVRWMFTDIVPDYILGQTSCALYLSLRYHLLHPDYIYHRIRELTKGFRLRVVLCHVDVDDVIKPLHEVTKTCLLHDCSLLCAWSQVECARYLETIKSYENKPADYIQERTDNDYLSRLTNTLTTVRHVNKTNVVSLGAAFGTLAGVFQASMDDLARCPGIGERKVRYVPLDVTDSAYFTYDLLDHKVKRLYDAFHEPFRRVPMVKVKVEQTDGGDVTSSQVSEVQTEVAESIGIGGEKTGDRKESLGQESLLISKLLSREGDVSVREALNAARTRLIETPSPTKTDKTTLYQKEKISPNKRRRAINTVAPSHDGRMGNNVPFEKEVGQATSALGPGTSDVESSENALEQASKSIEEDYVISIVDD